jgi:hypothetical protein
MRLISSWPRSAPMRPHRASARGGAPELQRDRMLERVEAYELHAIAMQHGTSRHHLGMSPSRYRGAHRASRGDGRTGSDDWFIPSWQPSFERSSMLQVTLSCTTSRVAILAGQIQESIGIRRHCENGTLWTTMELSIARGDLF